MDKLRECPLCGETDITDIEEAYVPTGKVGCTNCSCEADRFEWNTRATDKSLQIARAIDWERIVRICEMETQEVESNITEKLKQFVQALSTINKDK